MTICNMSLATNQDDGILRECVKNNEMNGSISVAFETEPSFFDSMSIRGRESQVMVGKTKDDLKFLNDKIPYLELGTL